MAENSSELSIAVGDRVVYPNQGVCRVSGVEAKEVAGQTLTFVTMRREEDGALVMVPQSKVGSIGLRRVSSKEEVGKIFAFLKSDADKANLDWKQRARVNSDRMSQGGLQGLAEVVKGLQVLSELRPLPAKERELYDSARHLLVSEIAASLNVSDCDAEDAVDVVLFPPGRERPKRTAEEFKAKGAPSSDEDLELGEDLLSAEGELPGSEEVEVEAEAEEDQEEEASPKASKQRAAAQPKSKKASAKAPSKGAKPKATAKSAAKKHGPSPPASRGKATAKHPAKKPKKK